MNNILFVCTGNTCRSPMAEAILKNYQIEDVQVRSAGVFAVDGAPASRFASKVLHENNISHDHSSSLLTEDRVNWATYIFTMTESHKAFVLERFPHVKDKTYTLIEFVENSQGDVSDPYGGNEEIYRYTYSQLDALIKRLIQRLNR